MAMAAPVTQLASSQPLALRICPAHCSAQYEPRTEIVYDSTTSPAEWWHWNGWFIPDTNPSTPGTRAAGDVARAVCPVDAEARRVSCVRLGPTLQIKASI